MRSGRLLSGPADYRACSSLVVGRSWRVRRCGGVYVDRQVGQSWQIELENFLRDDAAAVEGVDEPEIGRERSMGRDGGDAIFEGVVGGKAENTDGFDADVLISGGIDDGGIGLVNDGAGEDVDHAAAWVGDAHKRKLDFLKSAVEVEIEAGELAYAEFVVDFYARVNFLAA